MLIDHGARVRALAQYNSFNNWGWLDDIPPLQAQPPYTAPNTAPAATQYIFFPACGLRIPTVRPFNPYGARQSARAVIPTAVTQILSGRTGLRLGSLRPTRDFSYVE